MDSRAVEAASDALEKAVACLKSMRESHDLVRLQSVWSDFLVASHRIYSKLEQGAKASDTSAKWFATKRAERKNHPLLRYLHHARNADEHGLAAVTQRNAGELRLGVGPGAWRFDGVIGPGRQMKVTALGGQVSGESKFAEIVDPSVCLVAVMDRGVTYEPPMETDEVLDPHVAAANAVVILTAILVEAEKLALISKVAF